MSRQVVFGAGQVGRHLVAHLDDLGVDVVAVSRHGRPVGRATAVAGDARDPSFTATACAGADVVYFCLNATDYRSWPEQFPPLQRSVLAGAVAADARLVVLENLYAYGPTGGRDLVETLPTNPSSPKAATRAAMTAELLDAHRAGDVEVAIGRASDFFGPGTTESALGTGVFAAALAGRRAQVMGRPDQLHSYSYTPDVAAALVSLGTQADATGRLWHLPIAETRTTRQVAAKVYEFAERVPRLIAARAPTLRLLGLVRPPMRDLLATLYQFDDRLVVDDSAFRAAFPVAVTPLDDALGATLDWFRSRDRIDAHPHVTEGAPR